MSLNFGGEGQTKYLSLTLPRSTFPSGPAKTALQWHDQTDGEIPLLDIQDSTETSETQRTHHFMAQESERLVTSSYCSSVLGIAQFFIDKVSCQETASGGMPSRERRTQPPTTGHSQELKSLWRFYFKMEICDFHDSGFKELPVSVGSCCHHDRCDSCFSSSLSDMPRLTDNCQAPTWDVNSPGCSHPRFHFLALST